MLLSLFSQSCEPGVVVVSGELGDDLARDDEEVRSFASLFEVEEDIEQVVGAVRLCRDVQPPISGRVLASLDLDREHPGRVRGGSQNINPFGVP